MSKKKKLSEKAREELQQKLHDKKTVRSLQEKLSKKIEVFNQKHETYIFCYPNGIKMVKKIVKSTCFMQKIYVCHAICENKCKAFTRKSYICRDIGCGEYRSCELLPFSKMKAYCKRQKHYQSRLRLIKIYNRYFYLMSVFRGLKIDPTRTLRYLKNKKKKDK